MPVYECNWNAVQVYLRCPWDRLAGLSRALFLTIRPTEIQAVAAALEVPFDVELLDKIAIMVTAAREVLNED